VRSPTTSAELVLTLWTDDAGLARRADTAGIDRIGVDLERLGKAERQRGRGTWISQHRLESLALLAPELRRAAPFARVDPPNPGTARQVEGVIAGGARVVMFPMVSEAREAELCVEAVAGRAVVVLLVESGTAIDNLDELAAVEGVDELHLGINDLSLSLGLANRWQVLAGDIAASAGERVRAAGRRFGKSARSSG
jgi:2-keto-3-deoxy-L-rhamnonate aldolase RhmA